MKRAERLSAWGRLIDELTRLPGIGKRSAERIAFHLIRRPAEEAEGLAEAVRALVTDLKVCSVCGNLTESDPCAICGDPKRDGGQVMVVERPSDVAAFEQLGIWRGVYHVLLGRVAPLDGVGEGELNLEGLVKRVKAGGVEEVVLGTSPTLEGDGTGLVVMERLAGLGVGQQMKLAPRMIQSMEILQMSLTELEERIEQELASNPTLELAEPWAEDFDPERERRERERVDREGERELRVEEGSKAGSENAEDFERLESLSNEYGESWSSNTQGGDDWAPRPFTRGAGERDAKMDAMANTASRGLSLYEQLMDQWRLVEADDDVLGAGEYLISQIDADGYLRTPLEELATQSKDGWDAGLLRKALLRLQQALEPAGLGARDLRECLLLQIEAYRRSERDESAALDHAELLVDEFLEDIEGNRLPKIAKESGLTLDEIKEGLRMLRHFQPHPGRQLSDDGPRSIVPDAVIEYDEETDSYTATLTNSRLPSLQISPSYQELAKDKSVEKRTREFVGNNLREASWLLDAIVQRQNTLLRVINVVVLAQRAFFEQGESGLKPLPMTQVADQLGIHVATVSRAVSEKYLQTPRGIYPLRMFFSGGTETEEGDAMSWAAVQAKLREVVDGEDKSDPMSDDALADALKARGIDIARRTVAKYRKQLGIPAARQRREY
jgi:RNA polymerase sigma-54 factor